MELAASDNLLAHEGQFRVLLATIAKRMGRYNEAEEALTIVEDILSQVDDSTLGLHANIQRASLRYHLGDYHGAVEIACAAYGKACRSNQSAEELDSLLLLARLTDKDEIVSAGRTAVTERKLAREKRILDYARAEFFLEHDRVAEALAWADRHLELRGRVREDLESAWMNNLAARIWIERNAPDRAEAHLASAKKEAQDIGLLPDLITTLSLQGRLAKAAGSYEEAFTAFKQALEHCRTVASSIVNEVDRELYQQKPIVQFLASEIRSLGQYLGNKQGAGR
jgi:tetratricopeptide (TPR) repeat protein